MSRKDHQQLVWVPYIHKIFQILFAAALLVDPSGLPAAEQEKITIDLGNGVKMEFIQIKAGKFMMGSEDGNDNERPVHEVTITKDYWMQTTEVTQEQWMAVLGTNPSHFKGEKLPVDQVKWGDAHEFLEKLNEKVKGQFNGKKAGLPTEAEWEYACRAGEKGKWCFGDDEGKLGDYAWYGNNSERKTHPVGQKKANAWGLYDMHGNMLEWCEDGYGPYKKDAGIDPTGTGKGKPWCLRGGCWKFIPTIFSRSANRGWDGPIHKDPNTGLRATLHEGPITE